MDEAAALSSVRQSYGRDVQTRLGAYVDMIRSETAHQNLIARSTIDHIWSRHILDSLQLLHFAPDAGEWMDIGSGAGLPGLPVAIAASHNVIMIEPRRLRADFIARCITDLRLKAATVEHANVERVSTAHPAAVISARAVAPLDRLLSSAHHLAHDDTVWILPKGRTAHSEVESARRAWHGTFHVKQSVVDPTSGIVISRGVRPR